MIARSSSLCPVCGVYIAKSRSRIAALPVPITVQPHLWAGHLRDGWWRYDPTTDHRHRKWVHERCYEAGMRVAAPGRAETDRADAAAVRSALAAFDRGEPLP